MCLGLLRSRREMRWGRAREILQRESGVAEARERKASGSAARGGASGSAARGEDTRGEAVCGVVAPPARGGGARLKSAEPR